MKKILVALVVLAMFAPAVASAQHVSIRLGLPAAPRLVVVSPGIQVIEDYDEEIFFHNNYYWVYHHGRWYRARQPHAEFVYVADRHVPQSVVRLPRGHYRHYRPDHRRPAPHHRTPPPPPPRSNRGHHR